MRNNSAELCIALALCGASAIGQTTVTNSNNGVAGAIPVYSGATTLGAGRNSAIYQSGSSVGIGTTEPLSALTLGGANTTSPNTGAQVDYNGENLTFENTNGSFAIGSIKMVQPTGYYLDAGDMVFSSFYSTEHMRITAGGDAGIGTPTPTAPLNIASGNVSAASQIYNAITIQPGGGSAQFANGSSIVLESVTNSGIEPIGGIWSSLWSGGNGGSSYNGALVLGTTRAGASAPVEAMRVDENGNVGIGTTSPAQRLEVNGIMKVDGGVLFPGSSTPQTTPWTGVLCGGDYAEAMSAAGGRAKYELGDVLVLTSGYAGSVQMSDVQKSAEPYSTIVAGIYATKPGVGRRQALTDSTEEIPMAMVGVVPTKVSAENGSIQRGDLLVTSSTAGYAMKGTDRGRMLGAVIGKAMGELASGNGTIEVLVTLQ